MFAVDVVLWCSYVEAKTANSSLNITENGVLD